MDYISRQKQRILATYGVTPIQKSEEDSLEKGGKQGMVGEIREWDGKKFKKQSNGKWLEVSEHGMTKKEHGKIVDHTAKEWSKTQKNIFTARTENAKKLANDNAKHRENFEKLSDKEYDDSNFEKGGEGSRGGKVIGYTKSGKPIYDTISHSSHKNFTKQDHDDAYNLVDKKHQETDNYEDEMKYNKLVKHHRKMYQKFSDKDTNVEKSSSQDFFGANIHQQQSLQKAHLLQSFQTENTPYDLLEKGGKRATIGEVRTWGGEKWVKHQDGWVHVHPTTSKATLEKPGGKRETASEDHTKHYKEHIDRHDRESLTKQGQKQAELMDEGYSEVDADRIANEKLNKVDSILQKKPHLTTFANYVDSYSDKEDKVEFYHKDGSVLNATLKTDSDVEDMKKIADTKSGDKKVEDSIEDLNKQLESKVNEFEKHFGKLSKETKSKFIDAIVDDYTDGDWEDASLEDLQQIFDASGLELQEKTIMEEIGGDEKKDKSLDKYKALGDREKLEVDGVTYKLELIKHPKDRYNYHSQPTFSVKLTHPSTGEIKVMPNAIKFHSGYDQGPGASSKQQWYADVAGYGTGNGGGQSSTSSVYVNRNQREHLAELFSSKKHYQELYHKHQDSIVTFPKGTKTEEIKRGLDN